MEKHPEKQAETHGVCFPPLRIIGPTELEGFEDPAGSAGGPTGPEANLHRTEGP